ncbi:two-component sensor histidine kinase [Nonomuraea sp. NN258]|nr:two-component sensor histidine kinase [Nonomuraea antri]
MLAASLTLLGFVPTLSAIAARIGDLAERPSDASALVLTVAQSAPLAVRSRWPAVCLAVTGTAFALHQALSYPPTFASIGLYLAVYAAGAHQVRFRHGLAAASTAGYAVLAVVLHSLGSPSRVQDFVAFYLTLAVVWTAGGVMRRWRAEEAERRRLSADVARAAERARIARELHDVVTHHVTAMVVQADAAQLTTGTTAGLAAISDSGRRALTELRHLLGVLEATGEPGTANDARGEWDSANDARGESGSATIATGGSGSTAMAAGGPGGADRAPTLAGIAGLVENARLSGQPAELAEHGERRPHAGDVELAAYRVVQEALTNAMKHAPGRRTTVTLHHHPDHLAIEVTNDGPAAPDGPAVAAVPAMPAVPSGGRGLDGLRRRVRLLDGELVTGQRPDGGFGVRARIPARSET